MFQRRPQLLSLGGKSHHDHSEFDSQAHHTLQDMKARNVYSAGSFYHMPKQQFAGQHLSLLRVELLESNVTPSDLEELKTKIH
jgi:hypothetical protein